MRPEEAARLVKGDRIFVQADSMLPGVRGGIYTILGMEEIVVAGRKSARVKISDDPETWCRPQHLGRVSRGQ